MEYHCHFRHLSSEKSVYKAYPLLDSSHDLTVDPDATIGIESLPYGKRY